MHLQELLERSKHFFNSSQYVFTGMNGMGHIEKINQYFVKLNKTDLDKYAKHKNIASYPEIVAFIAKIKKGYQAKDTSWM